MKIHFLKPHAHFAGNGLTVFYRPGDADEFADHHARALVYEGIAAEAGDEPSEIDSRETKVEAPAETKPAKPRAKK